MQWFALCPRKGAELFLGLVGLGVGLSACEAAPAADVVATYRGGTVTLAELEAARQRLPAAGEPAAPAAGEDRRLAAVEEAALRELLAARTPADDPALARAIAAAEEEQLAAAMAESLGWNRLEVDDATVRRLYDEHPERYHDPEKLRLQHIFRRAESAELTPGERQQVATDLERIRREILAGADFAEMARRHSESATAEGGGFMVLKPGDAVFPAFAEAAWGLEPGEVSEPVDTPTGFQLVKLVARIPPVDRPFEDVREFVREQAVRAERRRREQAFLAEGGRRLGLERRYDRLRDPWLDPAEPLVLLGDLAYTFTHLAEAFPEPYQSHLYNRYFAKVEDFLDQVALRALLAAEARAHGLDRSPELEIRRAATAADLRAELALAGRLEARAAAVPEDELRAFFESNRARYQTLRTTTLRVLLLEGEPDEHPWQTLKRAEALAARLRSGEDFAEAARRLSRHYSARQGGLLEDLTDHGIGRLIQSRARNRRRIEELEVGEVSDPFVAEVYEPERLRFVTAGVYIVRVEARRPPVQAEFAEVVDLVRANYLRRHYQRLVAEEREAALAAADLVVYDDHLPPL